MNDGTIQDGWPSIDATPGGDVDAYLDRRLDEWAVAKLDRRFDAEPALARERDKGHSIDAAIARLFAPPTSVRLEPLDDCSAVGAPLASHSSRAIRPGRPRSTRWGVLVASAMAVAAAIVVAVVTVAPQRWFRSVPAGRGEVAPTTPEALYARLVGGGFRPYWTCADDAEFRAFTAAEYSTPFAFVAGSKLEVLGWAYQTDVLGRRPGIILARVDGMPVVVLVDRAEQDRPMTISPASGLELHRRELAGVVLYEITPASVPSVISAAVATERP